MHMQCNAHDVLDLPEMLGRRELFLRVGTGLTGMALATLLADDQLRAASRQPHSPKAGPGRHFLPKAKAVIQLFQHGGPSHIDLLDPKPELNRQHDQPIPKSFTDLVAISRHGNLLGTPHKFFPAGD